MATKPKEPGLNSIGGPSQIVERPERALDEVYGQMARAAADFSKAGLAKDSKNLQQGFNFRGIDGLMDLASPILARHHLLMLPAVRSRSVETRETRNGGLLYNVVLDVEFHFVSGLDGSSFPVRVIGEAMDSGDKATNKAMSAAYKYAMFQSFCIPISGQMDEADLTTVEETVAKPPDGYAIVKLAAQANAVNGSQPLKDYAKSLKDTPQFPCWDYLVKVDKDWPDIKATAERVDKVNADRIAADVKATGTRVPGEEG